MQAEPDPAEAAILPPTGQGIGSGLFTASQSVHLAPALGETLTISDSIGGGGIGLLDIAGPGNVVFLGAVTGTTIELSGTGQVISRPI